MTKPRIIKSYDKLSTDLLDQVKLNYPYGFEKNLIQFKGIDGKFISALPYETEDHVYLIKMTRSEAQNIIEEDDDYDEYGVLIEDTDDEMDTDDLNDIEDIADDED